MPVIKPRKATLVRALATIVLCVGANLTVMQAAQAMSAAPAEPATTVGARLGIFAPAMMSLTLTAGFFGVMLALAALIERPLGSAAPAQSDEALVALREAIDALRHSASHRPEVPAAPVLRQTEPSGLDRVVHLLEEIREIALMDEAQRAERLRHYAQRRKSAIIALVEQHVRREEWSQADELIHRLSQEHADDPEVATVRRSLELGRAEAEADALERAKSSIEDMMAVGSWDQAHALAESFTQDYPKNADGQALLQRITRERDVFRDSTVQRLYDQIKRDVERRQWRKALAGAQRLLERFPDHPKTTKTRQLLRTVQDNAEIEERQEHEAKIQQLIKSKRFDEAITFGEELIRRFPLSPQADAMDDLLPKLRELAIKQEAEKL